MTDVRVIERAATNEAGQTFTVREEDGYIVVTWGCGAKRTFSVEGARELLDFLDLMSEFPCAWLRHRDTWGGWFFARIESDTVFATEAPDDWASGVSWKAMRKMLSKAIG